MSPEQLHLVLKAFGVLSVLGIVVTLVVAVRFHCHMRHERQRLRQRAQRGFTLIELLIVLMIVLGFVVILGAVFLPKIAGLMPGQQCAARWEGSGYETRHSYASGCQVHLKDGRWVPERAVREAP